MKDGHASDCEAMWFKHERVACMNSVFERDAFVSMEVTPGLASKIH